MEIEYKNFIGTYSNVYPPGYCNFMIDEFERLKSGGAGYDRQSGRVSNPKHEKDDYSIFINIGSQQTKMFEGRGIGDVFFDGLQACYEHYTSEYSVLKEMGSIRSSHLKMQRTRPGGGYHVWHTEHAAPFPERVLVYILYLNTIPSSAGGETEFLYQKQRINPVENTMVIWPASYTHTHRGNPVLDEKYKYIITGWFNFD